LFVYIVGDAKGEKAQRGPLAVGGSLRLRLEAKKLKAEGSKGAFGGWRSASLEVGGELAESMAHRA